MRGGRLRYLAGAVVLVVAAVVIVATVRGGDADGEPPGRPSGAEGEWVQIVGGGDTSLQNAQDEALAASDVDLDRDDLAAMAAAEDGTLWLLDRFGALYDVSSDGMVRHHGTLSSFDEAVAAEIGPDGQLYVASHNGQQENEVRRIDLDSIRASEARVEGLGTELIRGMAVARDGHVYVADSSGTAYRLDVTFGASEVAAEAVALEGTPPAEVDCPRRPSSAPTDRAKLVDLTTATPDTVVVADPMCPWIYTPGTSPDAAPAAPGCFEDDNRPGAVLTVDGRTLVVGFRCRIIWEVAPDGTADVLVSGDPTEELVRMSAATDGRGNVYVMDEDGVWAVQLPEVARS